MKGVPGSASMHIGGRSRQRKYSARKDQRVEYEERKAAAMRDTDHLKACRYCRQKKKIMGALR